METTVNKYDFNDLSRITTHSKARNGQDAKKGYEAVLMDDSEKNIIRKIYGYEINTKSHKEFVMKAISKLKGTQESKKKLLEFVIHESSRYIVILTDSIDNIEFFQNCFHKNDLKLFDNYLIDKNYTKFVPSEINIGMGTMNDSVQGDIKKVSRAVKKPELNEKIEFLNKLRIDSKEALNFLTTLLDKTDNSIKEIKKAKTELKVSTETLFNTFKALNDLKNDAGITEDSEEMKEIRNRILSIPYPYAIKYQKMLKEA